MKTKNALLLLNGKKLDSCIFPASELLKGGSLILEMEINRMNTGGCLIVKIT